MNVKLWAYIYPTDKTYDSIMVEKILDDPWRGHVPRVGDTLELTVGRPDEEDWLVRGAAWHEDGDVTLYLGRVDMPEGMPADSLLVMERHGFQPVAGDWKTSIERIAQLPGRASMSS